MSNKVQTILIALGIGIGLSVNIFVGSLIQSLQDDLIDSTVGTRPHIIVDTTSETEIIENWQPMIDEIKKIDSVIKIVTALDRNAFIMNLNPESPNVIILRGFELDQANGIYDFYNSEKFVGQKPTNQNEVIVGIVLVEELGLEIGDQMVIQYDPNPMKPNTTVSITGVFDLGFEEINRSWVLGSTELIRSITQIDTGVTSINLQVDEIFEADNIAEDIKDRLNDPNLEIINWKETNEQLLNGLAAQAQSSNVIILFVLLAVGVSIASILSITVMQKSKQIGILKAMGLTDFGAAIIFLLEGLFLGVFGSILGVLIGLFLIFGFNTFATNEDAGLFSIIVDPIYVLKSISIALIFATVASIIPARRSSKMEVIEIIRNN